MRIGFAKVPSKLPMPYEQTNGAGSLPSTQNIGFDQGLENYHSNLTVGLVTDHPGFKNGPSGVVLEAEQQIHTMMATTSETQLLMRELSGDDPEVEGHVLAVQGMSFSLPASLTPPDMLRRATYYTAIPQHLASHPVLGRRYGNAEALRLRDLRKRFDDNISPQSVDEVRVIPLLYVADRVIARVGAARRDCPAQFRLHRQHHCPEGVYAARPRAPADRPRSLSERRSRDGWPHWSESRLIWPRSGACARYTWTVLMDA